MRRHSELKALRIGDTQNWRHSELKAPRIVLDIHWRHSELYWILIT
jgi:hypothetical protein